MRIAQLEIEVEKLKNIHNYNSETIKKHKNINNQTVEISKHKKPEKYYQLILEKLTSGKHKQLQCGITDITTENAHIEIKSWCAWKSALGQLICYDFDDPKEHLYVYLFGEKPHYSKQEYIFNLFKEMRIEPFELVDNNKENTVEIKDASGTIIHKYCNIKSSFIMHSNHTYIL